MWSHYASFLRWYRKIYHLTSSSTSMFTGIKKGKRRKVQAAVLHAAQGLLSSRGRSPSNHAFASRRKQLETERERRLERYAEAA
ncbi:hypothetical protein MUK42_34230 [Musa troglodytarum]|uniref:Uncharacterized protein n=1 Tax=Musa troglodytarum TaxID=320322 RepID=A0A9E7H917_9LILI|nr:hypothetical protein MUK42_34230 [Musa troglodytarum]